MSRRNVEELTNYNRSVANEKEVSVGVLPWRVFRMVNGVPRLQCHCGQVMELQRNGDMVMYVCKVHPFFQVSQLFASTFPVMLTAAYRPKIDLKNLAATDQYVEKAMCKVVVYLEDRWIKNSQTENNLTDPSGFNMSYMDFMMQHTASTFSGAPAKVGFGGGYSVQLDCRRKASYRMPAGQPLVRIYDPTIKEEKRRVKYFNLRNVGVKQDGDTGPNFGVLEEQMDSEYAKLHKAYLQSENTVTTVVESVAPPAPATKKAKAPVVQEEESSGEEEEDEDGSDFDEQGLPSLGSTLKAPKTPAARVSARVSNLPYARS